MKYLSLILVVDLFLTATLQGQNPSVVPTFECAGFYWKTAQDGPCTIRYKEKIQKDWNNGLELVYDVRDGEYRGSIVGLKPNTTYQAELTAGKSTKVH